MLHIVYDLLFLASLEQERDDKPLKPIGQDTLVVLSD